LRLCFSHFATRTVDNTVDLYAAKPDIRPESRFYLPHLHSTPPLGGLPSEYRHPVWYGKTRMVWLPNGEKISKISILFDTTHERDRHTDRRTDTAWRHRPRLCIASRGKNLYGIHQHRRSSRVSLTHYCSQPPVQCHGFLNIHQDPCATITNIQYVAI